MVLIEADTRKEARKRIQLRIKRGRLNRVITNVSPTRREGLFSVLTRPRKLRSDFMMKRRKK